jgi:hypothetical protein
MRRWFVAAMTVLVLLYGLSMWFGFFRSAPDLRSDLDATVAPGPGTSQAPAKILGSQACRDCHSEIYDRYATSGHSNTFHSTDQLALARHLDGVSYHDTVRDQSFTYSFDSNGLSVALPSVFGEERFPLNWALGSGVHGVTFLTLLPHLNGQAVGLEHRVTWYGKTQSLDLTVGHPFASEPVEDAEHFGRIIDGEKLTKCLECHTTNFRLQGAEIKDLIPHVGCESCHGAGQHHVAEIQNGHDAGDYRVEAKWATAMAEMKTCGACHRLADSLKKSELSRKSIVLPRFQPAGLMQSRCFTESNGAMRCTTCHDPHLKVSHDRQRYEQICLDCHDQTSTSMCSQASTNCVTCHMPPVSLGVAEFHDHWIRVRGDQDAPVAPVHGESAPPKSASPVLPGH